MKKRLVSWIAATLAVSMVAICMTGCSGPEEIFCGQRWFGDGGEIQDRHCDVYLR